VQYLNNRDFSSSAIGPDSGPEVIDFVPATSSPNGRDLIVVANEITGTVSIYATVAPRTALRLGSYPRLFDGIGATSSSPAFQALRQLLAKRRLPEIGRSFGMIRMSSMPKKP
jgi:hypothetical protein